MPRLGVNIDHVATVRQIRAGIEPEPVYAALIAEAAGADGIVVHLREDRRHIRERDLFILKEVVKTRLNLEMSVARDIVEIACKVKPDRATLVPEKRHEITTEGGLNIVESFKKIREVVKELHGHGIGVSLFIDPDRAQIEASKRAGVKMVELHTGCYANACDENERKKYLEKLKGLSYYAKRIGLQVFAGHGLDYFNVSKIAKLEPIEELNIGYSIVCRSVIVGLDRAVREMKQLIG